MNSPIQSPSSKILVLGTAHELQGKHFQMPIDDKCYRHMVEDLIQSHHIDTIFEEASGHSPSDAQEIADSQSPKLPYFDVDPPIDERPQYGLATVTGSSKPIDLMMQPPCVENFQYVKAHADRERFWLTRVAERKFKSAMFICGASHTLSIAFRLVDAGYEVEQCLTYQPYAKLCRHVPAP